MSAIQQVSHSELIEEIEPFFAPMSADLVDSLIGQYNAAPAAPTVKAEQVQCEVCHGQGEVYSGHDQHFHYFDFQPPEPIMEVCPECGGEEAPSLPAAGSAVEGVEVVAYQSIDATRGGGYMAHKHQLPQSHIDDGALQEPLMTVAQHERIVAVLRAQIAERDAAIEEWSGTAVQNGMEVDRLSAALSAQQSAHVSVPRELLERVESHLDRTTFAPFGEPLPPDNTERRELRDNIRALLNGGEA